MCIYFPLSLSLSESDKVCASAGNPPSGAQLYIPWDIQRNTSSTRTCCNRQSVCTARCATPHPENSERENMDNPLLAVLDMESIPCQHGIRKEVAVPKTRGVSCHLLKLLFLPTVHMAQERNNSFGQQPSLCQDLAPLKGGKDKLRARGLEQQCSPFIPGTGSSLVHSTAFEGTDFTAPCSGPQLPGKRII